MHFSLLERSVSVEWAVWLYGVLFSPDGNLDRVVVLSCHPLTVCVCNRSVSADVQAALFTAASFTALLSCLHSKNMCLKEVVLVLCHSMLERMLSSARSAMQDWESRKQDEGVHHVPCMCVCVLVNGLLCHVRVQARCTRRSCSAV